MDNKLTKFDPFTGMTRWGDTLEQFFSDLWSKDQPAASRNLLSPAIDISEDKTALTVTAELPGLDRKDIQLEVKDGVLTLRGEKKFESESKEKNFHRVERRYGSFYRALALPDTVDASRVEAAFKNGVLSVKLPKREESKPKSIQIQE